MSAMMTELQRNDLLSEWMDMSREATINNPKEKSVFRKEFEHSKLKEKSKNKGKGVLIRMQKAFYRSYLFGFFLLCSSNLKRPVYTEHINLVN